MVLLGALAASDALPFADEDLLQVIRTRTNPKYLEANLCAFRLGVEAAQDSRHWRRHPGA
jgi:Pyruvate/2-oxoacid:ferredoxin oxidoreductase gamma subunit